MSANFAVSLAGEFDNVVTLAEDLFSDIVDAEADSIINGSAVTGSLGQPVASGDLLRSWTVKRSGRRRASIETDNDHAIFVEHAAHGYVYDAGGGGAHSVKKSVAGFGQLAASVSGGEVDAA